MATRPRGAAAPEPGAGLVYPWSHAPAYQQRLELTAGVHWVRMPLPFALDHINLWMIEDDDGWTLVDTGVASDDIRQAWESLLPPAGRALRRMIITHFHPDHLGLAGWLQQRHDAPLLASASEWLFGSLLYYDVDGRASTRMLEFYASHGLSDDWLRQLDTGNRYRRLVSPPPTHYQRLRAGDRIRIGANTWQVMIGVGHSPEHVCLYCAELNLLISGDQILPRITPNISVYASEPDANPLQDYLDSLAQFRELPHDVLVLPAHGFPFRGLHARLDYIEEHHGDRFEDLLRGFGGSPVQAAEILPQLFKRRLDPHQMMFAMGETLAHLACLVGRGDLRRQRDDDGRYWYSR